MSGTNFNDSSNQAVSATNFDSVIQIRLTSGTLDLTTGPGDFTAVTNTTGKTFICTGVILTPVVLNNIISDANIYFEDINTNQITTSYFPNLGSLLGGANSYSFEIANITCPQIANGDIIQINITPAVATTYTVKADFLGYLI